MGQQRGLRRRARYFDYKTDDRLVQRYRLSLRLIVNLCKRFEHQPIQPTPRSSASPVLLQLMVALKFFRYRQLSGRYRRHSQHIATNCILCFGQCSGMFEWCGWLVHLYAHKWRWSHQDKKGFHDITSYPNAEGAIDDTCIAIKCLQMRNTCMWT